MSLATALQVREHYPSLVGTGEDALLDLLIARADGLMAAYCGYPACDSGYHTLEDVTYTLYLEATDEDARILRLPVRPVQSVTSVNVDPTWTHGSDTAYTPASDVLAVDGALYLKPTGALAAWSPAPRANKVVVVAGYATTPPALVAITAFAVRSLLDRGVSADLLSASAGRGSYSQGAAAHLLPDAVRAALDTGFSLWRTRAA